MPKFVMRDIYFMLQYRTIIPLIQNFDLIKFYLINITMKIVTAQNYANFLN